MKNAVIASILIACLCFFTADINLTGTAVNYGVFGRGLTWASDINNSFVFDTNSTSTGVCLTLVNNDTNPHSFALSAFETTDRSVSNFSGSTAIWSALPVTQSPPYSVPASGTLQLYVNLPGASSGTLTLSGGSGAGTVDAFYTLTPTPCGVSPQGTPGVCDKSAIAQATSSSTSVLVAAPPAGLKIHVCGFTEGGDVGANGTVVLFSTGTAGGCGALGNTEWQVSPHTGGSNYTVGSGAGQMFQTTTAAQPLCFTNGASGATQFVSAAYGIF